MLRHSRVLHWLGTFVLLTLLAGCGTMALFGSRDTTIPLARIQEGFDKRFPLNHRVMEMFDIKLTAPRISLSPEDNRVIASFELVVLPPLTSKTWRGSFKLSGGLRIDSASNTIYLRDAKIEDFSVETSDPAYKRQIAKLGSLLLDRYVQETPVYTLTSEQTRLLGTDYSLVKINARSDALVLSFEPIKK
ncbi:MAG: DUF1439 domain-containing protein [Burkholderiales bacterium]|nr:DUF1439 domain-containing protein [Burkholderiales bacterium]